MASIRRYESNLSKQRTKDMYTQDLGNFLATESMLRENFRSDDRVVAKRMQKEHRAMEAEEFRSRQLEAAASNRAREQTMREQDERLAAALATRKAEQTREMKNIQRVCEQSEELRVLEEKLKAAYVNKEREAQVFESAAISAEQDRHEALVAQAMEEERQKGLQAEAYREHLRAQDGAAMLQGLNDQMQEKEDRKKAAYAEFLKEKDMVDRVVQAILDEDSAERVARDAKEEETRKYIDDFIKQREEYKAKREREIAEENEQIRTYAEKVMTRELELRIAREQEQNSKDAILEKLSADMARRQAEADEMERLRNELMIQETEENILMKEKEKMERAIQQRLDVALANEYQRQLKAIKREEEKKEEDAFRAAMLDKFAEDDRIDMLNAQKRREKQIEHRREIERLLEDRRARFEEERAKEMQEQIDAARVADIRRQIIEEERKRLLAAAAKNLGLRHLPKGVLSYEDDVKLFNNDVHKLLRLVRALPLQWGARGCSVCVDERCRARAACRTSSTLVRTRCARMALAADRGAVGSMFQVHVRVLGNRVREGG
eukprot:CAMPEP_0119342570 /NCGR_PEP_ID=MMETSP1333-20130426/104971_1 /TAXON_ID=418940 /ORGANISM="Scyphosphaera apsteinii, Strain RCC1455" /LENGTH=550 /DNA_ID=CAMNT_0007354803 /DNA_START=49 /DNA_END=1702 /DNA_ORIENTATION=+